MKIVPQNNNLSVLVNDRYLASLPLTASPGWYDLIAEPGGYKLVPENPANTDVVHQILVEPNPAGAGFRNFQLVGNFNQSRMTKLTDPNWAGAKPDPVEIDFSSILPSRARGVRFQFSVTCQASVGGPVGFNFGFDDTHFPERLLHNVFVGTCYVQGTVDILFREQRGKCVYYTNDFKVATIPNIGTPSFFVSGWYNE